jgi:hypothetical protein
MAVGRVAEDQAGHDGGEKIKRVETLGKQLE